MAGDSEGRLCPRFHKAIELIGSRWTGPIVQLLMAGPQRYAELRADIPHISDRMLSERLHVLETEGIVSRRVLPDPPIRVEYALTDKGRELQASLVAIGRWAERWIEPAAPAAATKPAGRKQRGAGRETRAPDRARAGAATRRS